MNESLINILDEFRNKRVLVIGDFYLDEYIYTKTNQLSPEAPVPRVIIDSKLHVPGAAGNVALGFNDLKARTIVLGVVGNDEYGKILKNKLEEKGVDIFNIIVDNTKVTGTFTRIIVKGNSNVNQHIVRIDKENKEPISQTTRNIILNKLEKLIPECDLVFIADYDENEGRGVINKEIIQKISELCKKHGKLSSGISRLNLNIFNGIDILIGNRKEVEIITKSKLKDNKEIYLLGKEIIKDMGIKILITTLSEDGLIAIKGEEIVKIPSFVNRIVDVCGAGDGLSVVFCLSEICGISLRESCEMASCAAAICISKEGSATATIEEIKEKIKEVIEKISNGLETKENNKKIAIFLDRDNTITEDVGYTHKIEDFKFFRETIEALRKLQEKYKLIIVTNQEGIARGFFTKEDYFLFRNSVHEQLRKEGVNIADEYFCPHLPNAEVEEYNIICDCHKPNSGMLEKAGSEHNLDFSKCWMLGDKPSDIQAGIAAGMRTIGIVSRESSPVDLAKAGAEKIFNNILEAANYINSQQ